MKKTVLMMMALGMLGACGRGGALLAARLGAYTGAVRVNGAAVQTGQEIRYGDLIETGADSFCEIIIGQKNVLRVGKDSALRYKAGKGDNTLELERGWLGGITRQKFTREGNYRVVTPTVTASIRGTSYCIKVESPGSTYFCTCNGRIALAGADGNFRDTVESSHHVARRFKAAENGSVVVEDNPGLLYHDDASLEKLAGVIGETMNWEHVEGL
jgi:hypothetical protein